MNWPLIKYVIKGAVRDRLILSLFVTLILCLSLSIFFGSSAIIEQDQFALVFSAGSIRIASVIGIILFIVFFMRRSYEFKDVDFLLSRPISRVQFILSYSCAFSIIAVFFALSSAAAIFAISPHLIGQGHIIWSISILIEYIIMANVALFFSMMLSSAATASMVCMGFYILSRMMGQILGIVQADSYDNVNQTSQMLESGVYLVSILMPRLDLMGQTSWLLYDSIEPTKFFIIVLQGCVFVMLIILASIWDLVRKQF